MMPIMQMPMMPNSMGNLFPGGGATTSFLYTGNVMGLQVRLEDARNQNSPISDATIMVTGNQIKEYSVCCMLMTTLLGSFFIIPLFFMCCNWWKKCANSAFSIPMSIYQKLDGLILNPAIKSITLMVCDNTFDKRKAEILYSMLSRSTTKGFSFRNTAQHYDYENDEWSNFKENMKPIKLLPIMSEIKWYDQVVL